jgi:hypothetical protein
MFDVGEVGHRGTILIRETSAVRRTPLSGHNRLDDYNRVGYNQINQSIKSTNLSLRFRCSFSSTHFHHIQSHPPLRSNVFWAHL